MIKIQINPVEKIAAVQRYLDEKDSKTKHSSSFEYFPGILSAMDPKLFRYGT